MRFSRKPVPLLVFSVLLATAAACTHTSTPAPIPISTSRPLIETPCDSEEDVAITNGVDVTIKQPKNVGDCPLTLVCRDNQNKDVGVPKTLINRAQSLHSFSCGAGAVRMVMVCRKRQDSEKWCKLEWLP